MRKILFLFVLLLQLSLYAYPPLPEVKDENEALLIRRIIDFWRDKEYPFAKSQIRSYLKAYPQSPCNDHFYAMLGDMAMHAKAYKEALDYYDKITGEDLKEHVQEKRWQALYHLEQYTQLYQETAPSVANIENEEGLFYFAEAAFREAITLLRYPEGKEEAKGLCTEALPIFILLEKSDTFAAHAKLAMAEIFRMLDQHEKAATLYLELADKEQDEEILLHAAAMLLHCDPEKGKKILEKLAREGGICASDAAFQWLQALAAEKEWKKIAQERDLFLSHIDRSHLPLCYFYLGMIAYDKEMFHQAIADLTKSVERGLEAANEKKALLAMLISAGEIGKLEVCDKCYDMLFQDYPECRTEAGFYRAVAYKKRGLKGKAMAFFDQLIQDFPDTTFAEKSCVERVRLHMEEKNWCEAHQTVLSFLNSFPDSKKKPEMVRLAIDLSLNQLAEDEVYAQLADDLERALASKIFNETEKEAKQILLAKAYLKLDQTREAIDLVKEMKNPDPLLMTHCFIKEGNSPEKVIAYGEEALKLSQEDKRLHLHLFNAYLTLSQECQEEDLTRKAAEHLDTIIDLYPVSLENRLWLGHYYVKEDPEKAIPIFESLIQTESNFKRFDEEALLLASLYQNYRSSNLAEELLEKIVDLKQKTEPEAKLMLAHLYLDKERVEDARALFQRLEGSAHVHIAYTAALQLARLNFHESPEQSLKKLHDLQKRKNLANEPIHLEAALDYAELKASTYPPEEKYDALLYLLNEVKEEFTKQDDILSKDYHASRELMPEKEKIYQAYMRYLDARIYLVQAYNAMKRGDEGEGKMKLNAARALLSTLRGGKYAVSKYLVDKATAGIKYE